MTPEKTVGVLEAIGKNDQGLFLAVLYYLGVRRGEALGLQWQHDPFGLTPYRFGPWTHSYTLGDI